MKPRILFIMHMPPPVHGAAMMGQYIHDSKVVNETFDCKYINPSASKTVASVGDVSLRKMFFIFTLIWEIVCVIRKWPPDVCYYTATTTGYGIYRDWLIVSVLKIMCSKVVLHLHNKGVRSYGEHRSLARWTYRHLFKDVKVILLAEALYQDVKTYVRREDVFICPNGIPETLDSEPQAERHNQIPHLLFLSNLLISKGVFVLLDACKILKDRGYEFVCEFVGGETAEIDAARFKAEVEKRGLNTITVYEGKKYGEEKQTTFEKADAFVFPTYNETFGLVNLEAMEHKLPVVTTNEGGISDVVKDGENGLIAERQDPHSLAQKIAVLLDSEELRLKMGENGYRKFKENFTLKAFETKFATGMNKFVSGG